MRGTVLSGDSIDEKKKFQIALEPFWNFIFF